MFVIFSPACDCSALATTLLLFQALSTQIQFWQVKIEEINRRSRELAEKGALDDTGGATGGDPRQYMNLDLSDVSDHSDTGVFPTPSSLLTTPVTPVDIFYQQAQYGERKDSGILTSPEGPIPSRPKDVGTWSRGSGSITSASDFSERSMEIMSPMSSSGFSVRSDDTDVLLLEPACDMEPRVFSDASDTATLVSDTDSSNTTYLLARADQIVPGYVPPGDTPDSSSTPSLVGADSYGRLQYAGAVDPRQSRIIPYLESSVDGPNAPTQSTESRPESRPDTEPRTLSVYTPVSTQVNNTVVSLFEI